MTLAEAVEAYEKRDREEAAWWSQVRCKITPLDEVVSELLDRVQCLHTEVAVVKAQWPMAADRRLRRAELSEALHHLRETERALEGLLESL